MHVRDFIYLDIERLKSIIAQAEGGLPVELEEGGARSRGVSGEGEGSLFGFLKAKGGTEFLWRSQEKETKSLHDNIYNRVEEVLIENELLVNISEVFEDDHKNENYRDKLDNNSFILTKGKVYINDFTKMSRILNSFNDIGEFIAKCSTQNLPPSQKSKQFNELKKDLNIPDWLEDGLDLFFKTFYKERVEIKLTPLKSQPEFKFVGNLNKLFLRDNISNITYKYGTKPVSEWVIFGQIASIPPKRRQQKYQEIDKKIDSNNKGPKVNKTPQDINIAIEEVFDEFRNIELLAQSVEYPEISITPIAVYRE